MSDFCYNVLALIPADSGFHISKAVERFAAEGYSAAQVTSPAGGRTGFQVVYVDNWAILAWLEDDPDTAEENQEILSFYGNPPNITSEDALRCDQRLSVWSDDDTDMLLAHLFDEYVDFLKEEFGLYVFDSVQGIWR